MIAQAAIASRNLAPYSAGGFADGIGGASAGRPQHPWLLGAYGPRRPPWNVAGVDYRVGIPEGMSLIDWRTLSSPNLNLNNAQNGQIKFNGDFTFQNIDFSRGIGAVLYNQVGPGTATKLNFYNCYFGMPVGGAQSAIASYFIQDSGSATIVLRRCYFDGTNMSNMTAFIGTLNSSNVDMQYCHFINSGEHILSLSPTSSVTIVYKYNLVDNGHQEPGAHRNYLQWVTSGQPHISNLTVMFNTCYQYTQTPGTAPGEGWQFYDNTTPSFTLTNPVFSNNTMIARPVPNNAANLTYSVSAIVHGPDAGEVTGGTNNNNYFDASGASQVFYAGTMVPSRGFSSSGNIDMNSGAILVPA